MSSAVRCSSRSRRSFIGHNMASGEASGKSARGRLKSEGFLDVVDTIFHWLGYDRERDFEPETSALNGCSFDTDASIHAFHRLRGEGQADADAGILQRWMKAFENPECLMATLGGDADAVVANTKTRARDRILISLSGFARDFDQR